MRTFLLLLLVCVVACKEHHKEQDKELDMEVKLTKKPERMAISDTHLGSAVIYEANIRQYSPEGTLNAFTKDIPLLKKLGVKILWLMPIHPISEVKRKAKNESSVEDIKNPVEKKKYLGSPYAVANYRAINPDMGTIEDFRELINVAHANNIFVIIDWVPNHTGWDHPWILEHPEYYTKNAQGEITDPINDQGAPWGWTDVADLNYDQPTLRAAMLEEMKYWVTVEGVDGFRCDVAHGVPASFWQQTIPVLRAEKDLFMLAEAEIPEIMQGDLFEMSYGWERHHLLNAIAKGQKNVSHFDAHMIASNKKWAEDDILMNFITNHDENAWAGPVQERMGDAQNALLALTYCLPGMPLIYSGQEYGLDRRLKFFEKDTIPKNKGATWKLLQQLGIIKNTTQALDGGKTPASYERLTTSNDKNVLVFKRKKGNSELIYMANLSNTAVSFTTKITGDYVDAMNHNTRKGGIQNAYDFAAWEYRILKK